MINLPTHEALFITVPTNEEHDIAREPWFQAIWKGVSNLFGWSNNVDRQSTILYGHLIKVRFLIESTPQVTMHVIQNPQELCPHAISFFWSLISRKWEWKKDGTGKLLMPSVHCHLEILHNLFLITVQHCKFYSDHWKQMHKSHKMWSQINGDVAQNVSTGLLKFSWVHHEAVRHLRMLQSCKSCKSHSLDSGTNVDGLDIIEEGTDGGESEVAEKGIKLMDFINTGRQPESDSSISDKKEPICKEGDAMFDPTFDDYASAPLQI